jgi:hypothetical protein
MNRSRRLGRVGRLAVSVAAAAPFACLWALQVGNAKEPLTAEVRLDIAIWMAVFGTPSVIAAQLLWRAWWRRAGAELSALDGPGWLLVAATATLPAARRDWGAAMTAELAQVQGGVSRWRFAAGCARTAVCPPGGSRAAVTVAGALTFAALAATGLATGAVLPAGRVFALTFVGLVGGLATLAVARSGRGGRAGPGPVAAGLGLAGVASCVGFTTWYVAEYPVTHQGYPPTTSATLPPATAVVLAVVLAGCLWLTLRPPRWLRGDRPARRFGVGMAITLAAGFVLTSRLGLRGVDLVDGGMFSYLFFVAPLAVLAGSAAAAAAGRSFRAGLWACAWATVLGGLLIVVAWLAEAPHWYRQVGGLLLDADAGVGMGANLGDAIWWTLILMALWALPLGVLGAAAGSARARRRSPRVEAADEVVDRLGQVRHRALDGEAGDDLLDGQGPHR